jgi:(p)ppGpp synthase/HD superfamily hydrolase
MESALRRAAVWHCGQTRRSSGVPYVQHVVAVAMVLDRLGFPEEVVVAGLLHDAVEDAEATVEEIAAEFGPEVAALVAAASERKLDAQGLKRPWIDRKTEHLEALREASVEARAVALADKLHNLTSLLHDLRAGVPIWSSFNAERDQVLWYYRTAIAWYGTGDPRLERLAAECRAVLEQVEGTADG